VPVVPPAVAVNPADPADAGAPAATGAEPTRDPNVP
jgi:hypothetical protein